MKTANHWTTPKIQGNLKTTQEALWTVLARDPNGRGLDLEARHDVEDMRVIQRTRPQVLTTTNANVTALGDDISIISQRTTPQVLTTTSANVTALGDDISIIADTRTIPKIP